MVKRQERAMLKIEEKKSDPECVACKLELMGCCIQVLLTNHAVLSGDPTCDFPACCFACTAVAFQASLVCARRTAHLHLAQTRWLDNTPVTFFSNVLPIEFSVFPKDKPQIAKKPNIRTGSLYTTQRLDHPTIFNAFQTTAC